MLRKVQSIKTTTFVSVYHLHDSGVDTYEVTSCGITAIGYQFVEKDTDKLIIIHPSTVKRIEEGHRPSLVASSAGSENDKEC